MLKATEVHISRANSGKLIIRYHQLGMQEAFFIEIDFYTRLQYIRQIRTGTQMRQTIIRTHWQHQTYIHSCQCHSLHSGQNLFRRQKIRSLYIEVFLCTGNCHTQPLHNLFPGADGVARYNLHQRSTGRFHLRKETGSTDQSTVNKIPVEQESSLQAMHRFTFQ